MKNTTIEVSYKTKNDLAAIGKFGQSYSELLRELINIKKAQLKAAAQDSTSHNIQLKTTETTMQKKKTKRNYTTVSIARETEQDLQKLIYSSGKAQGFNDLIKEMIIIWKEKHNKAQLEKKILEAKI